MSLTSAAAEYGTALTDDQRRARNVETMRIYFQLQEAQDLDTWFTLWADDASQSIPYAPDGFPRLISGRTNFEELYRGLFLGFQEVHIRDLVIEPLHDPDKILIRWHTYAPLTDGSVYENDLVGIFSFHLNGKISHLVEYLNPTKVNIQP